MKLLYLSVETHRCLKGASICFDRSERFEQVNVVQGANGATQVCLKYVVDRSKTLSANFWSVADTDSEKTKSTNPVAGVSCIIGENGSGKSSVASLFYNICRPVDDYQGRVPHYICIYRNGLNFTCVYWGGWKISIKGLPRGSKLKRVACSKNDLPFSFVYYTPFTTTEQSIDNFGESCRDISTGGILRRLRNQESLYGDSLFSQMAFREYLTVLRFVSACRNPDIVRPKEIPFPLPVDLDLYANKGIWNRLRARLAEIGVKDPKKDLKKIRNLIQDIGVISDSQSFVGEIVGAFFASLVLADWSNLVENDKRISKNYSFVSDALSVIRSHSSVQKRKALCDALVEHIASNKTLKATATGLNVKVAAFENFLRTLASWSKQRAKKLHLVNLIDDFCPTFYISEDDDQSVVATLADALVECNAFVLFCEFRFAKMSSGEMAYLTMLGRLYDVFCPHENDKRRLKGNVLIYLDEAETTLHPKWQRCLVWTLIWFIETFARGKSVQLVFASHSPILLSDIPRENVVLLRQIDHGTRTTTEWPDELRDFKTFGNNIFDLYRMIFTREESAVGAFADQKLNKALSAVADAVRRKCAIRAGSVETSNQEGNTLASAEAVLARVGDRNLQRYFSDLKEGGLL